MVSRLPTRWRHFYTGDFIKSQCSFPNWQLTRIPFGSHPNIITNDKPRIRYRIPYKNKVGIIVMKYSDFNIWFIKNSKY